MAESVALGVIGVGRIGRLHVNNITAHIPEARVVAVADVIEETARQVAQTYHIPHTYGDPRELMEREDIDAVVICSSTNTHAELIEMAARAGKHAFCEKPLDLDVERVRRVLRVVEETGIKLQVGFQRRFDPSFRRARELIASGAIGEPHLVRITSRDPAPPPIEYIKVSGGIFLDMTIHDFDMSRFLLGDEPEEIFATGGVFVDPAIGEAGDIDTALITLRFRSGALVSIDNSRKAVYGYDQRVEVFGSGGMIAVGNKMPDQVVHLDGSGTHGPKPVYFFMERYTEAYIEEMRAFVRSILEGTPPPVSGRDGLVPVIMGHAAWQSYREHRPVPIHWE